MRTRPAAFVALVVVAAALWAGRLPTAAPVAAAEQCGSPTALLQEQISLLRKAFGATKALVIPLDLASDQLVRTDTLVGEGRVRPAKRVMHRVVGALRKFASKLRHLERRKQVDPAAADAALVATAGATEFARVIMRQPDAPGVTCTTTTSAVSTTTGSGSTSTSPTTSTTHTNTTTRTTHTFHTFPSFTLFTLVTIPPNKLDYTRNANYGEANLSAGFSPDPYSVGMTTGGTVNVSYLGGTCSGFATIAPDLRINFGGGGASLLRIYFVGSNGDAAMVVNDPYGNFYCVDDSFGTVNPTIDFNNPAGGTYDVWIASFASGTPISGTLRITGNSGNHP